MISSLTPQRVIRAFDVDSTDATAVAAEILFGKTAYVSGNKLTGTMKNNGAVTKKITTRDEEVTIPQGSTMAAVKWESTQLKKAS